MVVSERLGKRAPRVLLFDLDDTLYRNPEIPHLVKLAITGYIDKYLNADGSLGCSAEYTTSMYQQYGTTLAGLVATGHKIDYDHWHKEVHYGMLDYASLLQPDPKLREILCSINLPKWVFTNGDKKHAELCLERLGIRDCFKGVFHFEWIMEQARLQNMLAPDHPVVCKPMKVAYKLVLDSLYITEPTEVAFFDDSVRNVTAAHELGMTSVLVGRDPAAGPMPGTDHVLLSLHDLPRAMPELVDMPGLVHAGHPAGEHAECLHLQPPASIVRA